MPQDNYSGSTPVPPSSGLGSSPRNGAPSKSSASRAMGDTASQIKNKATELGNAAAEQFDSGRSAAAGGIASAAASLHDHAEDLPGGERVASVAHSAADKLSSTADYIRNHDMDAMVEDVKSLVKNNPGPALLSAIVVGFLLGRSFSSRD